MKIVVFFFLSLTLLGQNHFNEVNSDSATVNRDLLADSDIDKKFVSESLMEYNSYRIWQKNSSSKFPPAVLRSSIIQFKEKEPNFIDTDLFLITVGSAIVFGATAAYFKLESDSAYEEYLLTDDKKLLDRTDRYDLYSGLALGALEINFGFLIYKFLTD
jgi:hypothetical protein